MQGAENATRPADDIACCRDDRCARRSCMHFDWVPHQQSRGCGCTRTRAVRCRPSRCGFRSVRRRRRGHRSRAVGRRPSRRGFRSIETSAPRTQVPSRRTPALRTLVLATLVLRTPTSRTAGALTRDRRIDGGAASCASSFTIFQNGTYAPNWNSGGSWTDICPGGQNGQPPTATVDGETYLLVDLSCGTWGGVIFADWSEPGDAVPGVYDRLLFRDPSQRRRRPANAAADNRQLRRAGRRNPGDARHDGAAPPVPNQVLQAQADLTTLGVAGNPFTQMQIWDSLGTGPPAFYIGDLQLCGP